MHLLKKQAVKRGERTEQTEKTLCIESREFILSDSWRQWPLTINRDYSLSFRIIRCEIRIVVVAAAAATAGHSTQWKSPAWATNSEKLINKIWQQLRSLAFYYYYCCYWPGQSIWSWSCVFDGTDAHFSSKFPISIFIICVLFHRRWARYRWSALLLGAIYRGTNMKMTIRSMVSRASRRCRSQQYTQSNTTKTAKQHPFEAMWI